MSGEKKAGEQKAKDDELTEALEATFPASDPVAVGHTTSATPHRPVDRKPPLLDRDLVEKLAEEVERKHAADDLDPPTGAPE